MSIINTWTRITEWFSDTSERCKTVRQFNKASRNSFVTGLAPTLLEARFSKGNSAYKHAFSSFLQTGFRIQVVSGRGLSKDEIIQIGNVILEDTNLVRRLISLGWDTLEIVGQYDSLGCQWELMNYAKMGKSFLNS